MPSTITTIYTFTAGTKARSAQVNGNFDLVRGNFIPIDPTAQSSPTGLNYGVGTAEHRWGNSFFKRVDLGTTTASWAINDSTNVGGNFQFLVGGVTASTISPSGTMPSASIDYGNIYNSSSFVNLSGITTSSNFAATTGVAEIISYGITTTGRPTLVFLMFGDSAGTSGHIGWQITGTANDVAQRLHIGKGSSITTTAAITSSTHIRENANYTASSTAVIEDNYTDNCMTIDLSPNTNTLTTYTFFIETGSFGLHTASRVRMAVIEI